MLHSGMNTNKCELASVNQEVKQHYNAGIGMLEVHKTIFCDKYSV